MTDDREFLRATADWLEAGSDRTPPHAIDAVLLAVRSTRQERQLPLLRMPFHLPVIARVALVAAALVMLALLAFSLILMAGRSVPIPVAVTDNYADGTMLTNGKRYITADVFPVRITFSGPDDWGDTNGWEANIGGPFGVWIGPLMGDQPVGFNRSIAPYRDACHWDPVQLGKPPSTVAGVVDALAAIDGVKVTDPSATIGGLPATLLTATAPGSLADCTDQTFNLWKLPLGTDIYVPPGGTQRIWVVDAGTAGPLVIIAEDHPDWPPLMRASVDKVLNSLQIEPTR